MKTYNLKVEEYGGFANVKAELPEELTWNRAKYPAYDDVYSYWTLVDAQKYESLIDNNSFGLYVEEFLDKLLVYYRNVKGDESPLPIKNDDERKSDVEVLKNYVCVTFTKRFKIASVSRIIDVDDPMNSWGIKAISIWFHSMINETEDLSIEMTRPDSIMDFISNERCEITRKLLYGDQAEKVWSESMSLALSKLQYRYNPSIVTGDLMLDPGITDYDSIDEEINKINELYKHL